VLITLAFDTTTTDLSVALADGNRRLLDVERPLTGPLASSLLPCLLAELKTVGLVVADIDRIAVCIGPGSFTGIRTGIAAALGLSRATNSMLFGYSGFDVALARTLADPEDWRMTGQASPTLIVLPTHRQEVFAQVLIEPGRYVKPATVQLPSAALKSACDLGVRFLAGEAANTVLEIGAYLETSLILRPVVFSRAATVAALAASTAPSYPLQPLYLQQPAVARPRSS